MQLQFDDTVLFQAVQRNKAAAAVRPSGQTVTEWPMRGNSRLINSCNADSSSANRTLRPLGGLVLFLVIFMMLNQWQSHSKLRPLTRTVAVCFDPATVIDHNAK